MIGDEKAKALEARLIEWSKFFRKTASDYGRSYPRESVEFREIFGKGVNNRRTPDNADAEEIELWVKELHMESAVHAKWASALRDKYFSHYNTTSDKLAKPYGITGRAFDERVFHAKTYLSGRLIQSGKVKSNILILTQPRRANGGDKKYF